MISSESWDAAVRALGAARSVALACHIGPDGDALGSMLALTIGLHGKGVETVAAWAEPAGIPKHYAFLPQQNLCRPPSEMPAAPDLMITFDAGSLDRLGSLADNARAAKELIVVDHHASNDEFGSINLVDADAAASAVLTYQLMRRLGIEIDRDMATCLYTGLVTDTGRFQYRNTTQEVHDIAGDLLSRGVAHDEISRTIYDTHPLGYLKLASVVLGRLTVERELAWSWVTNEDLRENEVDVEEIEGLIDLVRTVDTADVAAVLKQQADGRFRVSMRSKGGTDVGAICAAFDGGGHALAAGFTSDATDPAVVAVSLASALRSQRERAGA